MRPLFILVSILFIFSCEVPREAPPEALNDWFYNQRAYPSGKINNKLYHQEKQKLLQERILTLREGQQDWQPEGPKNIGGRITDVEMPFNSMDDIWIGAASGGAWKTTDRGLSWTEMTLDLGSPPIGDIAVRQTNPQEVWIGTGESNGGSGSIAYEGFGIFRSRNGGQSWENMGLENSGSIGRIALDPSDPFTIYVAAMGYLFEENSERGIFRSRDGGKTWENILYLGPTSGGSDIIVDPNDPDILYASVWERIKFPDHKIYWGPTSGIYKSIDGGDNWTKLTNGLPKDSLCRIGIAMAPSNTQRLYALVTGIDGVFEGFYVTSDGGQSWDKSREDLSWNYRTAGYWYCNLTVDPDDINTVFLCGLYMIKTENAGQSFEGVCDMHVDQHSIFLHPMNSDFGLVGNDGGLYLTNNQFENCVKYKNIPITQFYTCTIDPIDDSILYGGTQDNNPLIRRAGNDNWSKMLGGDGFVTLPDPRNNDVIYTEYQYGNLFKSTDGGRDWSRITDGIDRERSNWNTPFMFEPGNPDVLYFGSHKMHKTVDGGDNWSQISEDLSNGERRNLVFGTITSIDVSPLDINTIIAGTDDGNVWITRNGGTDWLKVSENLPDRWVTSVTCDPHDGEAFFVTYSGLKWHEYLPHVFRSDDGGSNWVDLSQDLPEVPVNDLIVDPVDSRRYWIATDLGVFETFDGGQTWELLGQNIPVAIVNDIDFRADTRMLLAATYGRSMYSIEVPPLTTLNDDHEDVEVEKVVFSNGGIHVSGKGMYKVEVYNYSGQFLYAEKTELNVNEPKRLAYSPETISGVWIVVLRNLENNSSQAFKIMQ
ncbi:MAG: hypothetical protein R3275_04385 [Saprospiraceae bacterium]|nr:hypothetical protein [Saprospiraceae bacterium]